MIIGITCTDAHWGIGKNNGLLFNLKEDMKFFRETTANGIVVMGYNTLLSLPGSKPLKNRTNIVLAPDSVERDDCLVVHTFDALENLLYKYNFLDERDVFIIGGGMMYNSMLPYYDKVYVTKVDAIDPDATVFFPNLDANNNFICIDESKEYIEEGLSFKFTTYKKIS